MGKHEPRSRFASGEDSHLVSFLFFFFPMFYILSLLFFAVPFPMLSLSLTRSAIPQLPADGIDRSDFQWTVIGESEADGRSEKERVRLQRGASAACAGARRGTAAAPRYNDGGGDEGRQPIPSPPVSRPHQTTNDISLSKCKPYASSGAHCVGLDTRVQSPVMQEQIRESASS